MKFKNIYLNNVGPFLGKNKLDFDTTKDKSLILIGGNNGSGKTTLLNLLKIGLYGNYAFGLKVKSSNYFDKINDIININKPESDNAYIQISFDIDEEYIRNNYRIKRTWSVKEGKVSEVLIVEKNNDKLNATEMEYFIDKLMNKIPQSLLSASFFDSEEVKQYFDDHSKLQDFLSSMYNSLFGLELFDILESDMKKYLNSDSKLENNSDNLFFIMLIDQLDYETSNSKKMETEYVNLKMTKDDLESKIVTYVNQLEELGKMEKISKNKYINQFEENELKKIKLSKEIKFFLEELYCFYLNKDLMIGTLEEIENEKYSKYANYIEEIINSNIPSLENHLLESILLKLQEKSVISLKYTGMQVENSFTELISEIDQFNPISRIDEYRLISKNNASIKKKLEKDKKSDNYFYIYNELITAQEQLTKVSDRILIVHKSRSESTLTLEQLKKQYDLTIASNKSLTRAKNSLEMAKRVILLSREYRRRQFQKHLVDLQVKITQKFNEIIRKENYLSKVSINGDTFDVEIYDKFNKKKKLSFLSAGEQQILLTTIIWAFIKLSKKNVMFTIDTPLARLDSFNRLSYLKDLISDMSSQILILSTDKEIDEKLYSSIKGIIHNAYTFSNDGENTKVKSGYFNYGGVNDEQS